MPLAVSNGLEPWIYFDIIDEFAIIDIFKKKFHSVEENNLMHLFEIINVNNNSNRKS